MFISSFGCHVQCWKYVVVVVMLRTSENFAPYNEQFHNKWFIGEGRIITFCMLSGARKQVDLTTFRLPLKGWGEKDLLGKVVCSANFLSHANQKWMRSSCDIGHKPAFNLISDSLFLCSLAMFVIRNQNRIKWMLCLPWAPALYGNIWQKTLKWFQSRWSWDKTLNRSPLGLRFYAFSINESIFWFVSFV